MKLKTEDPQNGLKAIAAFFEAQRIKQTHRPIYDYVFEHGQLWIVGKGSMAGAIWSVVDAEGPGTCNGFDFEQVAEAYEL